MCSLLLYSPLFPLLIDCKAKLADANVHLIKQSWQNYHHADMYYSCVCGFSDNGFLYWWVHTLWCEKNHILVHFTLLKNSRNLWLYLGADPCLNVSGCWSVDHSGVKWAIPINVKTELRWIALSLDCVHESEKSQVDFHKTGAVRCSMNC